MLYALVAYGLWGVFPLYWAQLKAASAPEVLAHRVAGTFGLLLLWLIVTRRLRLLRGLTGRRLRLLAGASALVTLNWLTYIWGVQNGHVVETSLGYFINPLVSVALGVGVLGERLRRAQVAALILAAVAVGVLALHHGRVPWIALVLAFSFAGYGLLKKQAAVAAVPALAIETAFVAPLAVGWLIWLHLQGADTLFRVSVRHDAFLLGAGLTTAVPLLAFGAAANRVPLSTLGLLQYLAPSIQFLCGVFLLGEAMSPTRWAGFGFVWLALALYAGEGLLRARRPAPAQ